MKVLEACVIIFLTVTTFYIAAALRDCAIVSSSDFLISKNVDVK